MTSDSSTIAIALNLRLPSYFSPAANHPERGQAPSMLYDSTAWDSISPENSASQIRDDLSYLQKATINPLCPGQQNYGLLAPASANRMP